MPVEQDREVLVGHLGRRRRVAGAVPPHGHPDGVADEPVGQLADVSFLGELEPPRFRRQDGSRSTVEGDPSREAMQIAFKGGLAYVGPFALRHSDPSRPGPDPVRTGTR